MTSPAGPPAIQAANKPEEIVEYDDFYIVDSGDLSAVAPSIAAAQYSRSWQNTSDGSSYEIGGSTFGVPGFAQFGLGPIVRAGGLSMGVFGTTKDFKSVSPALQAGVGGVNYTYGVGICSGVWCFGASGLAPIHPLAMILMPGIETFTYWLETDLENGGTVKHVATSKAVSNLIPIKPFIAIASFVGMPVGMGPKASRLTTIDEHFNFEKQVERLLAFNARPDALRTVKNEIPRQNDPFVKGSLMELKDKVIFEHNKKDLPSNSIEANIKKAVEFVESFTSKNSEWLLSGRGSTPNGIEDYMANAFYLAQKLNFRTEKISGKDGKIVKFKIRESSPFEMTDPEIAVRFIEAVAGVYRALGSEGSGLAGYAGARIEKALRETVEAIVKMEERPEESGPVMRLMEADARYGWRSLWFDSITGFLRANFSQRRDHMKWIVRNKARDGGQKNLIERLNAADIFDRTEFQFVLKKNLDKANTHDAMLVKKYQFASSGIEALTAVMKLERELWFADTLMNEPELRRRAWRSEVVDVIYMFGNLNREIALAGKNAGILALLAKASSIRLEKLIGDYKREAAEERRDYLIQPDSNHKNMWRDYFLTRLDELKDTLDQLDASSLEKFVNEEVTGNNARAFMDSSIKQFRADIEEARTATDVLSKDAKNFPANWGEMRNFEGLHEKERDELNRVMRAHDAWVNLGSSHDKVMGELEKLRSTDAGRSTKTLDEWKKKMESFAALTLIVMQDYRRFNIKRTGAAYMEEFLNTVGAKKYLH